MTRPKTAEVIAMIGQLITRNNNDADGITQLKRQISQELNGMETDDDPGFVDIVRKVADLAAAAAPPSKRDVEGVSHFGAIDPSLTP